MGFLLKLIRMQNNYVYELQNIFFYCLTLLGLALLFRLCHRWPYIAEANEWPLNGVAVIALANKRNLLKLNISGDKARMTVKPSN